MTNRQEPTLKVRPTLLTRRIAMPWHRLRSLSQRNAQEVPSPITKEPEVKTQRPSVEMVLSEEDRLKLIASLQPTIEEAIRKGVATVLEMSMQNALHRVRSDLDRSIKQIAHQALEESLQKDRIQAILRKNAINPPETTHK